MNNKILLLILIFSVNQAQSKEMKKYRETVTTTTKTYDNGKREIKEQEVLTRFIDDDYFFPNSSNIDKINAKLPASQKLTLPAGARNPPVPVSFTASPGYEIRYNPEVKSYEEVKEITIKKTKTIETIKEERF